MNVWNGFMWRSNLEPNHRFLEPLKIKKVSVFPLLSKVWGVALLEKGNRHA